MSIHSQKDIDALKQRVAKLENDLKALKKYYMVYLKDQTVVIKSYQDKHEMA